MTQTPPLRFGIACGLGFGLAGALAAKVFDDKLPGPEAAFLGLELATGVVVGFLIGCRFARWLHRRVALRTMVLTGAILGFAVGITFAIAMTAWWTWQLNPPFGSTSGFAMLGLWNGLLLGVGLGERPPAADPQG